MKNRVANGCDGGRRCGGGRKRQRKSTKEYTIQSSRLDMQYYVYLKAHKSHSIGWPSVVWKGCERDKLRDRKRLSKRGWREVAHVYCSIECKRDGKTVKRRERKKKSIVTDYLKWFVPVRWRLCYHILISKCVTTAVIALFHCRWIFPPPSVEYFVSFIFAACFGSSAFPLFFIMSGAERFVRLEKS